MGTMGTGVALEALAAAPPDEISLGARLDVLHALAKKAHEDKVEDFPDYDANESSYLALANSIAAPQRLDPQTVLDDLTASVHGTTKFSESRTAEALPHQHTAFVGEDVCTTPE